MLITTVFSISEENISCLDNKSTVSLFHHFKKSFVFAHFMSNQPKEKLPSIEELRATLFEIPKSLQKLLEKPVGVASTGAWGPLTNQDDPNVELNSDLVAKSVAESLRKQQQQLKVTDAGGLTLEPSSVIELNLDGENISSLGRPPYPLIPLTKLRLLVLSNNRLSHDVPSSIINNNNA